nr:ethylene-responsive transcription factor CRF1-like [Ipomoea trifida]
MARFSYSLVNGFTECSVSGRVVEHIKVEYRAPSMFPGPVKYKYSEHRRQTKMFGPAPAAGFSGKRKSSEVNGGLPRVVRISVTDDDATDSSGDEGEPGASGGRRRVKKYVNEVTIERCGRDSYGNDGVLKRRKMAPAPEADNRLKKKKKPESPSLSGYNSGEESHASRHSPNSVFLFNSEADSEPIFAHPNDVVISENFSSFSPFPDHWFENPVQEPGLFHEPGFPDEIFEESCYEMFIGSSLGLGSSTIPADDYFQDFEDIFGSDPLVAL